MDTKLHHFAYTITSENLDIVIELFEKLGCVLAHKGNKWCLIKQGSLYVQIIEAKDKPIHIETKTNTHIGFLSDTPKEDIEKIENWAEDKGIGFRKGGWSEKESKLL